jgi:hypothetical protein
MGIMDCGTGKAAAEGGQWRGRGGHVDAAMVSSCYERKGVFFLRVVTVKYDMKGICRAFPTHTHENF